MSVLGYPESLGAVLKIVADISDRRGLRQEWSNIDEVAKEEIKATWFAIINEAIDQARKKA